MKPAEYLLSRDESQLKDLCPMFWASDGVESLSDEEVRALVYGTGTVTVSATAGQETPKAQVTRLVTQARKVEEETGMTVQLGVRQHVYNDWHWSNGPGNPDTYDPMFSEQGLMGMFMGLMRMRDWLVEAGWRDFQNVAILPNYERWKVEPPYEKRVRDLLGLVDRLYKAQYAFPYPRVYTYAQASKPNVGPVNVYLPDPLIGDGIDQEVYQLQAPYQSFTQLKDAATRAKAEDRPFSMTLSLTHSYQWTLSQKDPKNVFLTVGWGATEHDPALVWQMGEYVGQGRCSNFPKPPVKPEAVLLYPLPTLEALGWFVAGCLREPLPEFGGDVRSVPDVPDGKPSNPDGPVA